MATTSLVVTAQERTRLLGGRVRLMHIEEGQIIVTVTKEDQETILHTIDVTDMSGPEVLEKLSAALIEKTECDQDAW